MLDSLIIKILSNIVPSSSAQWYFLIICIMLLGAFFIWIKFGNKKLIQPQQSSYDDKGIKDALTEIRQVIKEHGESIGECLGRIERTEILSDSRNRDFAEELGGFKTRVYEKLLVIERFLGEVTDIVERRKQARKHDKDRDHG